MKNSKTKKQRILNAEQIKVILERFAREIPRQYPSLEPIVFIGIRTRSPHMAKRVAAILNKRKGRQFVGPKRRPCKAQGSGQIGRSFDRRIAPRVRLKALSKACSLGCEKTGAAGPYEISMRDLPGRYQQTDFLFGR